MRGRERSMGGRRGQGVREKNGRKERPGGEREEWEEGEARRREKNGRKKVGMLSLTSSQSQILIFFFSLLAFG